MKNQVEVKMKIAKPVHEVFEAIVDPEKISNFWFSSASERWEAGKTITLKYEEYKAQGEIKVLECAADQKIVFTWSLGDVETTVTMSMKALDAENTQIEVTENGLNEQDDSYINFVVGQTQGWVYTLTCLKAYLEFGVSLRAALVH